MTDTGTDSYNATISISGLVTGQTYSVATTVNNKAGFSTTSSAAELKPRTPTGITISDAPVANVTDLATGTLNATITYNDGSTETTGVLWSSDNTPRHRLNRHRRYMDPPTWGELPLSPQK